MKSVLHGIGFLLVFMLACAHPVKVVEPVETPSSPALAEIDSLMWQQPDSALAVMMEFAASPMADSLDVFNGHYCQVLIAELLYKNDYGQSNRKELVKAVRYFDSIVDGQGGDAIVQREAFLDARAHYMNGVGFYERDSMVAACGEYLKALEIMETHFPNVETRHGTYLQPNHIPRFMALTYGRLSELFDNQFMQNAIYCCKKALVFNIIEPTSPTGRVSLLSSLGRQYHFFNQKDSAEYYYNEAWKCVSDTNHLTYRDLVSQQALLNFYLGKGIEPAVNNLKRMAAKSQSEDEKLTRFTTIGHIYYETQNYDSALFYLTEVFENKDDVSLKWDAAEKLRNIYQNQGDTLKATQFAIFQVENAVPEVESNYQVSQLNELFQQHLQWEQERAEALRQQAEQLAVRQRLVRGVVTAVAVLLVLGLGLWWWMAKRRKEHEAETQTLNKEKQQLQTQVDDALQQLQTVDDVLQQLQTLAGDALQQARAMLPQRITDLYHSKVPNRLERIMDEFEAAYPKALERLAASCPELSETEQQIAVLNFLHFRAKEEADLLDLSENTVNKYRSNQRKKTENTPFSTFLD